MSSNVSAIIPCYNSEQYVGDTIESVLNQTHAPVEVVVIDDGSTDGSLDVIRSFGGQITWRTGENCGACAARNWGAELSSGDYLMFLDADDIISSNVISALMEAACGGQAVVAACPWTMLKKQANGTWKEEAPATPFLPPENDPIHGWLSGWYIPPCAVLWSREAYQRVDGWDESLHANQDGDIMLCAFLNGVRLVQTRRGKVYYRKYGTSRVSISTKRSRKAIQSRARVLKKAVRTLRQRGEAEQYEEAIGESFYGLARQAALVDDRLYTECLHLAKRYAGSLPQGGTLAHRVLSAIMGLQRKEKLAETLAAWRVGSTERHQSIELHRSKRPRVLYTQYTNPAAYPPLQHSSRLLADAGWSVLFMGIVGGDTSALRFPPRKHITVERPPSQPAGWRQKLHYLRYAVRVAIRALRWQPRWLYVSDPLAAPAGLLAHHLTGIPVIYHEHDSPNTQEAEHASVFMRFVHACRQKLARSASLCVLPNVDRARHFDEVTGRTGATQCVWNCPARHEATVAKPESTGERLRLLYHGSLNASRLPYAVLHAMTNFPSTELHVVGYETVGHRGYVDTLFDRAQREGVDGRVTFHGSMSRPQLMDFCRSCDVGLSFMPMEGENVNMRWMAGASNKPFDYLACGLPLIVSDLPDWREMYVEPGYGLACDPRDPDSIAEVLRFYVEHPERRHRMGKEGRQRVLKDWNYEKQFRPVFNCIENLR